MLNFTRIMIFAVGLAVATTAYAYGEARYCSTDGTQMWPTGEVSQRDDGVYEQHKCNGNPQHTRWYKIKY